MTNQYKTIEAVSEGIYKDRGSRFLAFAFPVINQEEINKIRNELKKKYHDARHHVYAFHLGTSNPVFRASDDGEPANSSGPPVLGQIRSFGLTNVLVVVVRYFGGTKLGVPGLINAYKAAANNALSNARIVSKNIEIQLLIKFSYSALNDVMSLIKNFKIRIVSQHIDSECVTTIIFSKSEYEKIIESLNKIQAISINE